MNFHRLRVVLLSLSPLSKTVKKREEIMAYFCTPLTPESMCCNLFLVVFFHIMQDELRKKGTTKGLEF